MAITALLPILFFSATNILSIDECYKGYGDRFIFLFLGGFILSLAFEKWDLHKVVSQKILNLTGDSNRSILMGFMLSTYLVSMWISNTATAIMMMPLASGVIKQFPGQKKFHRNLVLGIAYAASIGGMATIMGSPPNAATVGILSSNFNTEVSFLTWMKWGLPFSMVLLLVGGFILTIRTPKKMQPHQKIETILSPQKTTLNQHQKKTTILFFGVCLSWVFQAPLSEFLGSWFNDTAIAIIFASILFLPLGHTALLNWEDTEKLPWGILLMFGGGLTMAAGVKKAGWMEWLGHIFSEWTMNEWGLIFLIIGISILLTALMSNLAMVAIFIPIVAEVASQIQLPIIQIAIPVALASSCDFMFPMSTPPNAIAFATGHVKAKQMFKVGLLFNTLAFGLLMLWIRLML